MLWLLLTLTFFDVDPTILFADLCIIVIHILISVESLLIPSFPFESLKVSYILVVVTTILEDDVDIMIFVDRFWLIC